MSIELVILLIALVPVIIRGAAGWRTGTRREGRLLLIFLFVMLIELVFCNYATIAITQTFVTAEPHTLAAGVFVAIFTLATAVGAMVVNLRGTSSLPTDPLDRAWGAAVGIAFGALLGGALIVLACLILPSLISTFNPAQIPLVAEKPLAIFRSAEATIALARAVTPPKPSPETDVPNVTTVASTPPETPAGVIPLVNTPPATTALPSPVAPPPPSPSPAPKINYQHFSYDAALEGARQNHASPLTLNSAFRLGQLEEAKAKAQREGKLLGFIMVWDTFFTEPDIPMDTGSKSGVAHFYQVFRDNMVLVFVRHENELNAVPDAVKRGFFGPEEGGFAPNMAVVSADAQQYICEIPFGGNHSDGFIREDIFRSKIGIINAWLDAQAKTK